METSYRTFTLKKNWRPISFPVLSDSYRSIALAILYPAELVLLPLALAILSHQFPLRPTLNESHDTLYIFNFIGGPKKHLHCWFPDWESGGQDFAAAIMRHWLNGFTKGSLSRSGTAGICQSFTKASSLTLSTYNMLAEYIYSSRI